MSGSEATEAAGVDLSSIRRLVIKVGSSLLTEQIGIREDFIHELGEHLREVKRKCPEVVLVSSGAVAAGLPLLGWDRRPQSFTDIQVAAAVGQIHLFRVYDQILKGHGFQPAQYLLTSNDLADRRTFLNSRATLKRMLDLGLLPIVNENDALVIDSHHIGDNDHFASELANLLEADLLVLLTDVEGIYSDFSSKELLPSARTDDPKLDSYIDTSVKSRVGSGGMASKIRAARNAASAGVHTLICSGHDLASLARIGSGEAFGTLLEAPVASRMRARERWLATSAKAAGFVVLDEGAARSVAERNNSLLPIGVTDAGGSFQRGDVIELRRAGDDHPIAKGLSNYDAKEVMKIRRHHSREIESLLGYALEPEIVHRDNMVMIGYPKIKDEDHQAIDDEGGRLTA